MGRIAGTPIAVDDFRYQPGVKLFFLTHMHSDHHTGLTPTWRLGTVHCSATTQAILQHKIGLPKACTRILELNRPYVLPMDPDLKENGGTSESRYVTVTLIDAEHCPGSVSFLFQGDFGNVLHTGTITATHFQPCLLSLPLPLPLYRPISSLPHTGDLRYSKVYEFSLRRLLSPSRSASLSQLYVDDTFFNPRFDFPDRPTCTREIISIIEEARMRRRITVDERSVTPVMATHGSSSSSSRERERERETTIGSSGSSRRELTVLIGMDELGKEELLVELARRFDVPILVEEERYALLQTIRETADLPNIFTTVHRYRQTLSTPSNSKSTPLNSSSTPLLGETFQIRVVPKYQIKERYLNRLNSEGYPTIGFILSGWSMTRLSTKVAAINSKAGVNAHPTGGGENIASMTTEELAQRVRDRAISYPVSAGKGSTHPSKLLHAKEGFIYYVPYSLHSSFSEVLRLLSEFRPNGRVISVNHRSNTNQRKGRSETQRAEVPGSDSLTSAMSHHHNQSILQPLSHSLGLTHTTPSTTPTHPPVTPSHPLATPSATRSSAWCRSIQIRKTPLLGLSTDEEEGMELSHEEEGVVTEGERSGNNNDGSRSGGGEESDGEREREREREMGAEGRKMIEEMQEVSISLSTGRDVYTSEEERVREGRGKDREMEDAQKKGNKDEERAREKKNHGGQRRKRSRRGKRSSRGNQPAGTSVRHNEEERMQIGVDRHLEQRNRDRAKRRQAKHRRHASRGRRSTPSSSLTPTPSSRKRRKTAHPLPSPTISTPSTSNHPLATPSNTPTTPTPSITNNPLATPSSASSSTPLNVGSRGVKGVDGEMEEWEALMKVMEEEERGTEEREKAMQQKRGEGKKRSLPQSLTGITTIAKKKIVPRSTVLTKDRLSQVGEIIARQQSGESPLGDDVIIVSNRSTEKPPSKQHTSKNTAPKEKRKAATETSAIISKSESSEPQEEVDILSLSCSFNSIMQRRKAKALRSGNSNTSSDGYSILDATDL